MADFQLQTNQNVTVAIGTTPTATLDAGSVTAEVSDQSALTAVVSADQTSVLVTALGPAVTDVTVTVNGSVGGVACLPGVLPIDTVSPAAQVQITLTPGTPVTNA